MTTSEHDGATTKYERSLLSMILIPALTMSVMKSCTLLLHHW